jgi:N-methylhydantoinase A
MPGSAPPYTLGIDIGGTFTDSIALNRETGQILTAKAPTTPGRFVEGILASTKALGIKLSEVAHIVHGSTICTNALIEGKQARTGFIGTKGFSDEFDIQRMVRRWGATAWSSIYDLHQKKPAGFIPRHLRKEVDERVIYPGTVIQKLDPQDARKAIEELVAAKAEAVAVCFLWSTILPAHEELVRRLVANEFPSLYVCTSSDVAPVVREYERMVTTAVNASLMPLMKNYLSGLEDELRAHGFGGALYLMQSHGGIAMPAVLKEKPILTLRSGPVAGVVASKQLGLALKRNRIISCDIGGTSTDTSLIVGHEIPAVDETDVNYLPIKVPTVDVQCIGAGGGSIAYVDSGGALRVGPGSAGALPGPACYGAGGKLPTLTDANLLLGRLSDEQFCGGRQRLIRSDAKQSMEGVARAFGWSIEETASAINQIAVANIAASIRLQTIDRGIDPREFSLVAFGGAGPLHATLIAEACSIPEVIIPSEPGVFSSVGMVTADLSYYDQLGFLKPLADVSAKELTERFRKLERIGAEVLSKSQAREKTIRYTRSAAMRYALQEWEIRVPIPGGTIDAKALKGIEQRFHDAHRKRYGFAREDRSTEFVTLFVDSILETGTSKSREKSAKRISSRRARHSTRAVYVDKASEWLTIPVYDRKHLAPGDTLRGPFVVEEPTSTTFVQKGWGGELDAAGNIILTARSRRFRRSAR